MKIEKLFITILFTFCLEIGVCQTSDFIEHLQQTRQSYSDRGYELVCEISDSIVDTIPLVTEDFMHEANLFYVISVEGEFCNYCEYKLYYVNESNEMFPLDLETVSANGDKYIEKAYRFKNNEYKTGKYVLILNSKLDYYFSIIVFKRLLN